MNDLEQMAIDRLKAASDMSLMAYQQPLEPSNVVEPLGLWVGSTSGRNTGTGRIRSGYTLASHRDQKTRSKTFTGVADAMSEQWG